MSQQTEKQQKLSVAFNFWAGAMCMWGWTAIGWQPESYAIGCASLVAWRLWQVTRGVRQGGRDG